MKKQSIFKENFTDSIDNSANSAQILSRRMLKNKEKKGLYNPSKEKDSCGIGLVANIYDIPSKEIIDYALRILCKITHRGAVSADPDRIGDRRRDRRC